MRCGQEQKKNECMNVFKNVTPSMQETCLELYHLETGEKSHQIYARDKEF